MDWRYSSSSRAPALQVQSPEFKPQPHKKKKKVSVLRSLPVEASRDARIFKLSSLVSDKAKN
jgi:hypothetical protein